jgi:hypothetical protein
MAIQPESVLRRLDTVSNALSGRVFPCPEFKVLNAIVRAITIPVVDNLTSRKFTTQMGLHNNAMLGLITNPPITALFRISVKTRRDVPTLGRTIAHPICFESFERLYLAALRTSKINQTLASHPC